MTDLITYVTRMPERGETVEATSFATAPGGKGANQAVAAALLGSEVTMVACVGDDAFGTTARDNFARYGIDAQHVRVVAGMPSGVAPIFVEPTGENRILIVPGANHALAPTDVEQAEVEIETADVLTLQLEIPLETVYAAVEAGVRAGTTVILNPAPANPALDPARLRGVAYVVPNQTELALLTGLPTATREQATVAARALIARGVERVVVTLAADGALLVDAADARHIAPIPVVAVDTTGAGDAFIGGFAYALAEGWAVDDALRVAVRYAALSVTRKGTQSSFATREEYDAFARAAH